MYNSDFTVPKLKVHELGKTQDSAAVNQLIHALQQIRKSPLGIERQQLGLQRISLHAHKVI